MLYFMLVGVIIIAIGALTPLFPLQTILQIIGLIVFIIGAVLYDMGGKQ